MKNRNSFVAFVLGIVVTLIACVGLGIQPPGVAHAQSRGKWEYLWIRDDDYSVVEKRLKTTGNEGWEAVSIGHGGSVLMKRRKLL